MPIDARADAFRSWWLFSFHIYYLGQHAWGHRGFLSVKKRQEGEGGFEDFLFCCFFAKKNLSSFFFFFNLFLLFLWLSRVSSISVHFSMQVVLLLQTLLRWLFQSKEWNTSCYKYSLLQFFQYNKNYCFQYFQYHFFPISFFPTNAEVGS